MKKALLDIPPRFVDYSSTSVSGCNFTPIIEFNQYQFMRLIDQDHSSIQYDFERLHKAVMEGFGYGLSNSIWRLKMSLGSYFEFNVGRDVLTVWTDRQQYVGQMVLNYEDPSLERATKIKNLMKLITDCCNGIISCSDCGTKINLIKNKNHRYFAGIYCLHCWDTKWKELEAHENYN